ncbi:Mov34/MPN/PAD-1 family protein [Phaeobacter gallaeciensis]|uniref:Mov34/MPN/PAD-1 family protein n=1 Tax=Phaeobacter gallaeciensis TaxID=60890 RepID=UPI0023801B8B|nr:Mov34/MPN/PAD-1 family protein [Phaeobacter gallaeciensis]MDE4297081.1 Mov34/MPN/PAD-1 family protein [Phaeobacter gallaeciensis]
MTMNFEKAYEAAKKHARKVFPEESCGFIVDGVYIPVENHAVDPALHEDGNTNCSCRLCAFKISKTDTANYLGKAQMVIHSHPHGPVFPSRQDMEGQIETAVPWGIIALDEDRIGDPEVWGDQLPVAPLLERQFMHGIRDCYSLVRDTFRAGHEGLAQQGITTEWPFAPITLKEVPRDDAWWEGGDDFYNVLADSYGWKEIKMEEAQPGDVFLCKIRSQKFNHAGILVSRDLILHHLPSRFSRREPVGLWARSAGRWLRYTGVVANA